jgi:hypothetical protein
MSERVGLLKVFSPALGFGTDDGIGTDLLDHMDRVAERDFTYQHNWRAMYRDEMTELRAALAESGGRPDDRVRRAIRNLAGTVHNVAQDAVAQFTFLSALTSLVERDLNPAGNSPPPGSEHDFPF